MSVFWIILVRIFPPFSRIWTEYGETRSISSYLVQMRENAGKMRTRTTPNTDTFYVVTFIFEEYYVLIWRFQTLKILFSPTIFLNFHLVFLFRNTMGCCFRVSLSLNLNICQFIVNIFLKMGPGFSVSKPH